MSSEEQPGAGAPPGSFASGSGALPQALEKVRGVLGGNTVPPAPPSTDEGDDEEDGMLRMSFMEHLEELRSRIFKALIGVAVAAILSLTFSYQLWNFVSAPAKEALKSLNYAPDLVFTQPMESFNIIWFKLPLVCAIFLASPWL